MVQMLMNTLATSRCGAAYFGHLREPHIVIGAGKPRLCSFRGRTSSFAVPCVKSRRRNLKVQAGWLFKGSDKGSGLDPSCEHSESVNEDILMFFFELDLATRVQYEIAQQLRNKLAERVLSDQLTVGLKTSPSLFIERLKLRLSNCEKAEGDQDPKVKLKIWL